MIDSIIISQTLMMWMCFAIIGITVTLYAVEWFSIELVSLGCLLSLMLLFSLESDAVQTLAPEALLSGFANPALITILALLVIGQALFQTDALSALTNTFSRMWPRTPMRVIPFVLVCAAVISAFVNNTPVVVMFIPVLAAIAARRRLVTSKIMLPLSYISILGGMVTLIGSSTNLLASGIAVNLGMEPLDFFAFAVPGGAMAIVGGLYVLFVVPRLLPDTVPVDANAGGRSGRQFVTEIPLTVGHPLVGETCVSGLFPKLKLLTVRAVKRGSTTFLPPLEEITLRPGDTVILAATRGKITTALNDWDVLTNADEIADDGERDSHITVTEAMIPPGSRLVGRGIDQAGFSAETGCMILGVQRRAQMPRESLSHIRMEAGDVLLLGGRDGTLRQMRSHQDIVMLEGSSDQIQPQKYASRAQVVFLITVLFIASGVLPMVVSSVLGAFFMIATGCLNVRQAARAIDRRIFLLVGAAIAMALSLEASGGTQLIADSVIAGLGDASPRTYMAILFITVAVLTNVLSNNATAVLFTPIAISTAHSLGLDPLPFVVSVILGANASFATPISYQTNLLVMGPGHYKFGHYLKAGIPLIFIIWFVFIVVAPWYYGV